MDSTCMHTYIHTYIHTCTHTCSIRTYIHIYIRINSWTNTAPLWWRARASYRSWRISFPARCGSLWQERGIHGRSKSRQATVGKQASPRSLRTGRWAGRDLQQAQPQRPHPGPALESDLRPGCRRRSWWRPAPPPFGWTQGPRPRPRLPSCRCPIHPQALDPQVSRICRPQ